MCFAPALKQKVIGFLPKGAYGSFILGLACFHSSLQNKASAEIT
jgi:hypothetical protein